MVTCYNCGKQVSDETLICPECGALVRRYEAPPRSEQAPEQKQNNGGWQQATNQQPYQTPYAPPTSGGKFRYTTGFSVWLWLCVAGLAFFAGSFILTGLMITSDSAQSQIFFEIFKQQGLDLMLLDGGAQAIANIMYINAAGCLLMVVLELVLFFVRRRRAVLFNVIGSLVLGLVLIFLVGLNMVTIMILVAGMVNNIVLRRHVLYMKR